MTIERQRPVAIGAICAILAVSATAEAQQRFEHVTQEVIASVAGLEIISLRDKALDSCYTVFLLRPPPPAQPIAPVESTMIQSAAAERDRKLDALGAELARASETQRPGVATHALAYQFAGEKAIDDFAQLLQQALFATLDARLAEIAAAVKLAVTGPSPCPKGN
jgi:hypothetical protein